MLRTYAAFFSLLQSVVDTAIIGLIWIAVYYLRFYSHLFRTTKGIPNIKNHLMLMAPVLCICYLACLWSGLYKSNRVQSMFEQFYDLLKACLLSGLLIIAFFYYVKDAPYSRKLLILFVAMLFVGLSFSHVLVMVILRTLRKKGYNLRYYAVIGASKKGQQLVQDIKQMRWMGLRCAFFADNDPSLIGTKLLGSPVYGPIERISEFVKPGKIDEVYFTLSGREAQQTYQILQSLQCSGITIRVIPDWGNLISISRPIMIPIGSQVLFSAADSPLSGHKVFLKQFVDFVVAVSILIVLLVPMLIIALLIKLYSKGPIFYRQLRVGMDQREFEIVKFRTMKSDAEKESGPQWSKPNDVRCTPIGKWLRRTSLDELPQLINVIKGQMSLVGPRPERPCFTKQFSEEYRRYMLRHKVKTGITGWAQINDLRGNTSLRKRLLYDLYYVRNWSFGFDLWILLCTPWHVIKGENAH